MKAVFGFFFGSLFLLSFLVATSGSANAATWKPWGPANGEVAWLAADGLETGVVYAGTGSSGVYRSSDEGRTWHLASDGLGSDLIGAFAATADGTLWAASDEAVYRSADHAATWVAVHQGRLTAEPPSGAIELPHALVVAPTSETLYLVIGHELFRSRDAGATWVQTLVSAPPLGDLALDPFDPETLYLAAKGGAGGLLFSHDGGDHWDSFLGVDDAGFPGGVVALAVSPEPATRIVAATGQVGLQQSLDGGATWSALTLPNFGADLPREPISTLDFDPFVPSRLYMGWAGRSLIQQYQNYPFLDRSVALLGRPGTVTAHAVDAAGDRMYVARSFDIGFRVLASALRWDVRRFSGRTGDPAFDPRVAGRVAIAGGPGFFLTEEDGQSWSWRGVGAELGELFDVRFDRFADQGLLAAGTQGGFASGDDGVTWRRVAPQQPFSSLVQVDRRTLLALGCGLLRSNNGGRRWRSVLPCELDDGSPSIVTTRELLDVVVDSGSASRLYAIVRETSDRAHLGDADRVLRSLDGGATWKNWLASAVFAVAPSDSRILFGKSASANETVLRSRNGGRSFQAIPLFLPPAVGLVGLAVDRRDPRVVVGALGIHGALVSFDSGEQWQLRSDGLERTQTQSPRRSVQADPHHPRRFVLSTLSSLFEAELRE